MNKTDLQNQILSALDQEDLNLLYDLLQKYELYFDYDSFYYLSYSDGLILLEDYEEILALMDEALENGFVDSFIFERKGDALYALADYQGALSSYLNCDFDSDDLDSLHVLFMIALSYKELGFYEEAIPFFEDILLEEQSNTYTLFHCGLCYLETDQIERGREYLDRVVDLDDSFLYEIVSSLLDFGSDLFFHFLNRLSDIDDQDELSCQHYFIQGDYAKALPFWIAFTKRHPFLHNIDYLAHIYDFNSNKEKAEQCYQKILQDQNSDDSYYGISSVLNAYHYLNENSYSTYVKSHWALIEEYPSFYLIFLDFLVKMQDQVFLPELFSIDLVSSFEAYELEQYRSLRLTYFILIGQYQEAIDYLLSFSSEEFDHYYRMLVIAYFYQGDYEAVLEIYQKGMPNGLIASMAYMSYISLQRFDEADTFLIEFTNEIKKGDSIEEIDVFLRYVNDLSMNLTKEEL